jgi:hypothetical protein
MFPEFYFEHMTDHREFVIGLRSYIWAGLAGPLYVLYRVGARGLTRSLVLTVGLFAILVVATGVTSFISAAGQALVLVIVLVAACLVQSRQTIFIVRDAHARSGWKVHPQ